GRARRLRHRDGCGRAAGDGPPAGGSHTRHPGAAGRAVLAGARRRAGGPLPPLRRAAGRLPARTSVHRAAVGAFRMITATVAVTLLVLIFSGMPIAFATAFAGALGLWMLAGWDTLFGVLKTTPYR